MSERPAAVEEAIEKLIDMCAYEGPCQYDHHAYCQAHHLHEHPCPVGVIRDWKKGLTP